MTERRAIIDWRIDIGTIIQIIIIAGSVAVVYSDIKSSDASRDERIAQIISQATTNGVLVSSLDDKVGDHETRIRLMEEAVTRDRADRREFQVEVTNQIRDLGQRMESRMTDIERLLRSVNSMRGSDRNLESFPLPIAPSSE